MTDLSDFGGGIQRSEPEHEPDPADDAESSSTRTYHNRRCPAITSGTRQRCKSPISRMSAAENFCGTHGREHHPWTIDGDPEKLILITGELAALSLADLDPDDVDFDLDLIQDAVAAVQGGESA